MEKTVLVRAPAKVNLHLRVYGRRADGFHGLRSVFQAISLADEIVVGSLTSPDRIEIDGSFDCPPEATTVHKAVRLYREATGTSRGVRIRVGKGIPTGAGMGGGSSDGAAVLKALDALFGDADGRLGEETLLSLGARIGSDVPFFLRGAAAVVEGRGEVVSPFPGREDFCLVVAFPGFPVSTQAAFALLDRERPDDSGEADPEASELLAAYRREPSSWPFANSFEPYVAGAHPAIASVSASLRRSGSPFVRMSGSGSTVFGVFPDPESAGFAAEALKAGLPGGSLVALTLPLACVPSLE